MATPRKTYDRIQSDIDDGVALVDTGCGDKPMSTLIILLLRCENYQSVARSMRKYHVRALNEVELSESCMRLDVSPQDYNGFGIIGNVPYFTSGEKAMLNELI